MEIGGKSTLIEAALSTQNCLTFLRRMHELVRDGSQFVVATHSPIVLAYPGALIYDYGPLRSAARSPARVRLAPR